MNARFCAQCQKTFPTHVNADGVYYICTWCQSEDRQHVLAEIPEQVLLRVEDAFLAARSVLTRELALQSYIQLQEIMPLFHLRGNEL